MASTNACEDQASGASKATKYLALQIHKPPNEAATNVPEEYQDRFRRLSWFVGVGLGLNQGVERPRRS